MDVRIHLYAQTYSPNIFNAKHVFRIRPTPRERFSCALVRQEKRSKLQMQVNCIHSDALLKHTSSRVSLGFTLLQGNTTRWVSVHNKVAFLSGPTGKVKSNTNESPICPKYSRTMALKHHRTNPECVVLILFNATCVERHRFSIGSFTCS